ncbi:MAG: hypothetical protein KF795_03990 [Labilithrix sp.]|nr:hypothetical protein [Labilithrix sp.]
MAVFTVATLAMAWGCSRTDERLGIEIAPPPTEFGAVDAGLDAEPDPRELIAYCPSSTCPPGWTTCPSSRFPCDVNLRVDINNCGACGFECPAGGGRETFSCVAGACVMQCNAAQNTLDCDGLADNGCETNMTNSNHCGACGNKCSDPAKPCAYQGPPGSGSGVACGCKDGWLPCGTYCRDVQNEDLNCGACLNRCDATGGGAPSYPNTYYGCGNGSCGKLKCTALHAECDGDITNGCETHIVSDDNCGGCGVACPAGQKCRLADNKPTCMCPEGLTYCETGCQGGVCSGSCVDVMSDALNCGRCGVGCSSGGLVGARRTCDYGSCVMRCNDGRADCNNSQADGCEVDTNSDPENCGACGKVCDAVAGQACVGGQCVVEPCDVVDAGEVAR